MFKKFFDNFFPRSGRTIFSIILPLQFLWDFIESLTSFPNVFLK